MTTFDKGVGPTLYKLDSKGKLREWRMEIADDRGAYRTIAGLAGAKQAVSAWTIPAVKSQPTLEAQVRFEVAAAYKHQLDREYHETAKTVATAKMIEPMLAKPSTGYPGPCWIQPKLDGIRCIMTKDGMFSRQGQAIIAVPHLHAELKSLFDANPDAILDGELYNHDLREDFGAISSIVRKKNPSAADFEKAEAVMQYWVYDLVSGTGDFGARREQLFDMIAGCDCRQAQIVYVESIWCPTKDIYDSVIGENIQDGYEGSMERLPGYDYELGRRSTSLRKVKVFLTREYPLIFLEEGQGNWAGAAKRATLKNDDGNLFGAGIRGSYTEGVQLLQLELGEDAEATVRYFMLSPDNVPRFPVVIDIHPNGRKD